MDTWRERPNTGEPPRSTKETPRSWESGRGPKWYLSRARVLENEEVAPGVHLMRFISREIAARARPGQFVHVRCCGPQSVDPFLRRPFSMSMIDDQNGSLEILFKIVGRGTAYLSTRRPGDELDVMGPLGNGFPDSGGSTDVILVAGGVGIGPLASVAYYRHRWYRGSKTKAFVGARTASELMLLDRLRGWASEIEIATDDGSRGFRGTVTELLNRYLETHRPSGSSFVVFGCGPSEMLEEFRSVTGKYGIEAYYSLEERMACGVGACLGCSVEFPGPSVPSPKGEAEAPRNAVWSASSGYARVCVDGPVFPVTRSARATSSGPVDDPGGPGLSDGRRQRRHKKWGSPRVATSLAGIEMKSPVVAASGTVGIGLEYRDSLLDAPVGAIVAKTVTLEPRKGNPPPRVTETPAGVLNSIGLENPGLKRFVDEELPRMRELDIPIIVSIAGETVEEFRLLVGKLDPGLGIAGIELNISCPNVERGGISFGVDPDSVERVVREVKPLTPLPVIAKLSPNVADIVAVAQAAERAGADAISLVNTFRAMSIDPETRRPILGNVFGGLSGPAIKPIAVRMVWEVAQGVAIPVIGMGGITCARDALEFILAGARAVAVGSAVFSNPRVFQEIVEGIDEYLARHGVPNVCEIVGAARRVVTGEIRPT